MIQVESRLRSAARSSALNGAYDNVADVGVLTP